MAGTKDLLSALRPLDSDYHVFGAAQHQYQSSPVPDQDLASFERTYGIAIPDKFRAFLNEVGVGAGPYYGLLSLDEITQQIERSWRKQAEAPPSPSSAFPFTQAEAEDVCNSLNADASETRIMATYPCNGCIPICGHGCTMSTWLVVTGELRGSVWDVANDVRGEGAWIPATCPTGVRPHILRRCGEPIALPKLSPITTFYEWFAMWANRSLTELKSMQAS